MSASPYSLIPPSDDVILAAADWLPLHEVVFWLTDWPIADGESYYPDPMLAFNPKDYGPLIQSVYMDLETAIKGRKLPSMMYRAIEGVVFSVKPMDALVWHLIQGCILPKRLQALLQLYQFDDRFEPRVLINKLHFQAKFSENPDYKELGQFLNNFPDPDGRYCDTGQKALKRHLAEAIGFRASRGKQESNVKLSLRALPEIMRKENGLTNYNMRAFTILIEFVCEFMIYKLADAIYEISAEDFLRGVVKHPIVKKQLGRKAPEILKKVILRICLNYKSGRVVYL